MRFSDYLRVALGNIRRQKLRSALTVFAVVIGATSTTIMLALVTGAKDFFVSQFEMNGQLQLVAVTQSTDLDYQQARNGGGPPTSEGTKLTDALAAKIKDVPHVAGVAAMANVYVFDSLLYGDQHLQVFNPQGYEPNGVIRYTTVAGRELTESDGTGIVTLTTEYADKLGFKANYGGLIGQTVTLRTQQFFSGEGAAVPTPFAQPGPNAPNPQQQQQAPTDLHATVVGIVTSHGGPSLYLPMRWARGLLQQRHYQGVPQPPKPQPQPCPAPPQPCQPQPQPQPQPQQTLVVDDQLAQRGYQAFAVKADSVSNADGVAQAIRALGVGATTAQSYVQKQVDAFNIVGAILGGIGAIALAVAAIGVINTMVMAILERTREIGVMRACGATRAMVRRLYTFEAALLGFFGGVIGLGVGYGLTVIANQIINGQLEKNAISASNVITIPAWLIVVVLGATTGIGILAGLYPATRAARLDPVEALRYE